MKTYARIENGVVVELFSTEGDITKMFHPEWQWVETEGNVAVGYSYLNGQFLAPPPVESVAIPVTSVSRRQGRLALIERGKLQEVEANIAGIEDPVIRMKAQVEYEAGTWEIDNPFLQAMWAQIGGTPEELKDLFELASKL